VYDTANLVCADALSPSKVLDRVVGASTSSVAFALEGITADCTARKRTVASAHVDGISSMPEMVGACMWTILVIADMVTRRSRQAKSASCEGIGEGLKGNGGSAEGEAKKCSDNATK
jgi:hypothetical protein